MTDEQKSGVRQPVTHHMGRRCCNGDSTSRCIYMITITLADRSRPILEAAVAQATGACFEAPTLFSQET